MECGELMGRPVVIVGIDFEKVDTGKIFEHKLLVASLSLGLTDFHILAKDVEDATVHPKANRLMDERKNTIAQICDKLVKFEGERIDFYIMGAGYGNIADIVQG